MGPKTRESADFWRWSPITNSWPAGTTQRVWSGETSVGSFTPASFLKVYGSSSATPLT